MNTKSNCITDIAASVRRTSEWRRNICCQRFPDARNIPAAEKLEQIATEMAALDDASWAQLSKHYNWASPTWSDAVSETSRAVVFRGVRTSEDFVNRLIEILNRSGS